MNDIKNNQRIIKFRAWHPEWKRFIYFDNLKMVVTNGDYELKMSEFGGRTCFHCFKSDEVVYQQFTGLMDKNGKEIYDGDFLKILNEDRLKYYENYCHVWHSNFSGSYIVSFNHKYSETSCDLFTVNYKYEIVGNILETPKLLE